MIAALASPSARTSDGCGSEGSRRHLPTKPGGSEALERFRDLVRYGGLPRLFFDFDWNTRTTVASVAMAS